MSPQLREIVDPGDPAIRPLADLMMATFADPNIVLSEDRVREFIGRRLEPDRSFHALIAVDGGQVVGCTLFSYVPESGCGFSEYIVVHPAYRGRGLGRLLFNGRKEILDRRARECGLPAARGVFIEVENPLRTPQEYLERERQTALDAWDRWRVFDRLGFLRTSVPYVQPPLGPGKMPIYYLDLLFAPWDPEARQTRPIPAAWVYATVTPIWRGWVPDRYREFLDWLRNQMGDGPVELIPLFPSS